MNVLIACEESQEVCKAFRKRGHRAFSCDIQPCSGGHPEWHIQEDVTKLLNGKITFKTCDGVIHKQKSSWDLLIGFPPCTYLTNAAACRLYRGKIGGGYQLINIERLKKGILGRDLFMRILLADCERVAVENPVPTGLLMLPPYTQIIQPWMFGHPYKKKTCLWLKNLTNLQPTNIVEAELSWVSGGSKKADGSPRENKGETFRDAYTKSKTFPGIADAMAEQWTQQYDIQMRLDI